MGVGAGLYMCDVVVIKFTFAISSPDEFLLKFRKGTQPPIFGPCLVAKRSPISATAEHLLMLDCVVLLLCRSQTGGALCLASRRLRGLIRCWQTSEREALALTRRWGMWSAKVISQNSSSKQRNFLRRSLFITVINVNCEPFYKRSPKNCSLYTLLTETDQNPQTS